MKRRPRHERHSKKMKNAPQTPLDDTSSSSFLHETCENAIATNSNANPHEFIVLGADMDPDMDCNGRDIKN